MQRINKILWPTYLYVLFLLLYYSGPAEGIPAPFIIVIVFGTPLALWIGITSQVKKNIRNAKRWHYFALCSAPGIIFGLQMAYGFYAEGHGDNPVGAILPFTLFAILGGAFSGFSGSVTSDAKK
jgi:hypothetical protein